MWDKLVKIQQSEEFKQKLAQMKYANFCRKTKGRTCPLGIVGITEWLRHRLGRSLDEDEIKAETTRDKGFARRLRKKSTVSTLKLLSAQKDRENERLFHISASSIEGEEESLSACGVGDSGDDDHLATPCASQFENI